MLTAEFCNPIFICKRKFSRRSISINFFKGGGWCRFFKFTYFVNKYACKHKKSNKYIIHTTISIFLLLFFPLCHLIFFFILFFLNLPSPSLLLDPIKLGHRCEHLDSSVLCHSVGILANKIIAVNKFTQPLKNAK